MSSAGDAASAADPEAGAALEPGHRRPPARGWSLTEDAGGMSPVSGTGTGTPPHDLGRGLALGLDLDLGDDMNRRLHLYETAFDSRVAAPPDRRGEDVSNHAILAVSPAVSVGSQVSPKLRVFLLLFAESRGLKSVLM